MSKDDLIALAGAVGLVLALILSAWAWTSAPCGLWKYSKAGEVPARCLTK
ncbi:hypothetical protein ACFWOT_09355 [Streptomyces sp. NPDC058440]